MSIFAPKYRQTEPNSNEKIILSITKKTINYEKTEDVFCRRIAGNCW